MYIDSPIWHLTGECPCCNQHSSLILYTCDKCGRITAICDEVFTNFLNPLNISLDNIAEGGNNKDCPHCSTKNSLRPAKDFEIINIGLTPDQYE